MIQLIHKYKQSITWVFLFLAACFALSGVGLDIMQWGGSNQSKAITINDKEFDLRDLGVAQQRLENQYRQLFGENYRQLLTSFNVDVRQQAIDSIIDSELLLHQAHTLGFTAGEAEIRKYILTTIFKDQAKNSSAYSAEAYRGMLANMGISAREFENQIGEDLARVALAELLQDTSYVSTQDLMKRFVQQETKYSFVVASYDATGLMEEVPAPSEQDLLKFYEAHATDYELPAQVAYDYVVIEPSAFEKEVSVTPQDIELYYTDNTAQFTVPEQAKVRSIKFLYPKDNDPIQMAAVRERATKVREEAASGGVFETLVTTYSDDLPSKAVGGSRGWVARGKSYEAFDKAVFNTPAGSISEVIEADFGFEIVKVEERKPSGTRDLEEVKGEIEGEIRKQEAPAYAAAKAREVIERAKNEGKSLADTARSLGLNALATPGLISSASDPEQAPRGLTQQVMILPTSERMSPAVIDSGEASVLVQIKEFKEPTTASFEEAKEQALANYRAQEAKRLAESKAKELVEALKVAPTEFSKEAAARKALVKGPFEISRAKPAAEGFSAMTTEISKAIMASSTPLQAPTQYFPTGSEYVVVQTTAIKRPDPAAPDSQQELLKYSQRVDEQARKEVLESTLALLKSRARIDVNPEILIN